MADNGIRRSFCCRDFAIDEEVGQLAVATSHSEWPHPFAGARGTHHQRIDQLRGIADRTPQVSRNRTAGAVGLHLIDVDAPTARSYHGVARPEGAGCKRFTAHVSTQLQALIPPCDDSITQANRTAG